MPQKYLSKSPVIFGALAGAATLGAVQFASGHDLAGRFQVPSEPDVAAGINRAAKANREAVAKAPGESRAVLLRVDSLVDTSVLVRIPVQRDARNLAPSKPAIQPVSDKPKKMIACEPVVSVLTEVAKLLQPGKCLT